MKAPIIAQITAKPIVTAKAIVTKLAEPTLKALVTASSFTKPIA